MKIIKWSVAFLTLFVTFELNAEELKFDSREGKKMVAGVCANFSQKGFKVFERIISDDATRGYEQVWFYKNELYKTSYITGKVYGAPIRIRCTVYSNPQ